MPSAWGVDHGDEVEKGFGSVVTGLSRKLPGGALRAAKKEVRMQPKKPVASSPNASFLAPHVPTPRGPLPSLGTTGRTNFNHPMPSGAGRKEAGYLNTRRHVT
jgi:hypothetical protein